MATFLSGGISCAALSVDELKKLTNHTHMGSNLPQFLIRMNNLLRFLWGILMYSPNKNHSLGSTM